MSLSTWEQQALDSITGRLAGSDPQLAALLTAFTRHASDEQMPASERIRASWRRAIRCSRCQRRHLCRGGAPRPAGQRYRRLGILLAALMLWLVATVTVIVVTMALNHGNSQRACTAWVAGCAGPAPAPSSRPAPHQAVTGQVPASSTVRTQQASGLQPRPAPTLTSPRPGPASSLRDAASQPRVLRNPGRLERRPRL